MSKRAEEAAWAWAVKNKLDPYSMGQAYGEGYEQAEKDTIERAVMWLEEHSDEYNGSESAFDHMEEEMIIDFRKAMEEE